jgi:hypothetical protein
LSNHVDAGLLWAAALGRAGVPIIPWDYRRENYRFDNSTYDLLALKTPLKIPGRDPKYIDLDRDPWRMPWRACYWPDALGRDPESEAMLKEYDRVYTCLRPTPEGMIWLPTGWDPKVHYQRVVGEPSFDVVFLGTATPRKAEFLRAVPNKQLVIFGNGWGLNEPAYLEDYCQILSKARISINIHRDEIGLNRRFFESMACTFTLTDLVPGVEEILGHDLARSVAFSTPTELYELVVYFLDSSHAEERQQLWMQERDAIAPYTYDAAVRKVLMQ